MQKLLLLDNTWHLASTLVKYENVSAAIWVINVILFCCRPVVAKPYASYDFATQRLLCLAERYGRLMQVKADSFVANVRFNLAMGLAVVHVGQQLRELWSTAKKRGSP